MPISLGRMSKLLMTKASDFLSAPAGSSACRHLLESKAPSRLVDLRSPESFGSGFIPGSYSISTMRCVEAARRSGLFDNREIYLLVDDPDQLNLCCEDGDLGQNSTMAGWFGADALDEWRNAILQIASLDALNSETLSLRVASGDTIVLQITDNNVFRHSPVMHPTALQFRLPDLPLSLDGLPVETAICLMANDSGLATYASSLIWNFGFHKLSYIICG